MDIRMPTMDGLEAARIIVSETSSRVLMLTTFDSDEYVYAALRVGASGFLLKDAPSEQLTTAVRSVAAGDALIDPTITRRLIQQFAQAARPRTDEPAQLAALTPRERHVLRLVAQGLSNAEIADKLVIEESTAKTHVARILMKLGLRDRVQAVVVAYECGFVVPQSAEQGGSFASANFTLRNPHRSAPAIADEHNIGARTCTGSAQAQAFVIRSSARRPSSLIVGLLLT
jgi:DNA-binding NarL/FixJ family response regulator